MNAIKSNRIELNCEQQSTVHHYFINHRYNKSFVDPKSLVKLFRSKFSHILTTPLPLSRAASAEAEAVADMTPLPLFQEGGRKEGRKEGRKRRKSE
jgi:hypothetical protein